MNATSVRRCTVRLLFRKSRISWYQNRPKDFSSSCFLSTMHNCEPLPVVQHRTVKILSRISVREIFLVSVVCSSAVVNGSLDLAARAIVLQAFLFDEAKIVAA